MRSVPGWRIRSVSGLAGRWTVITLVVSTGPLVDANRVRAQDRAAMPPRLVVNLGHGESVNSVAFSPDGRHLLSGSNDHTARLWDWETGRELRRFEGHTESVSKVMFSPDGGRVLTHGSDDTARVWDVESGSELHRFGALAPQIGRILAAAFSPEGDILTASTDGLGRVRLWDAETGAELWRSDVNWYRGSSPRILVFSPSGQHIVTAGSDGTYAARLWNTETGEELHVLAGHSGHVSSLAYSPNGRYVVTAAGLTAHLWDATTGTEVRRFSASPDTLNLVGFLQDGRQIFLTSGLTTRVLDLDSGVELLRLRGSRITDSHDGRYLAGVVLHSIRVFQAGSTEILRAIEEMYGPGAITQAARFSPSGHEIVIGSWGARVWQLASGVPGRTLDNQGTTRSIAFTADGRRVLLGSLSLAELREMDSGDEVQRLYTAGSLRSAAISPEGRYALTSIASDDSTARIISLETGEEIRVLEGHTGAVTAVQFSPDGRLAVTGSRDQSLRLWDVARGQELWRRNVGAWVCCASFSTDGRHILAGLGPYSGNSGVLLDAASGEILRNLNGHSGGVLAVAISPDNRLALTGSEDNTARLWDRDTGSELRRFQHPGSVTSVDFSPDGRYVLTVSRDSQVRVFAASTGELVALLNLFQDGTWAVVDPEGRFDASNGGDVQHLHWVVGLEPIALDQLKERYYEPGLLAKRLGFNDEPLREVSAFDDVALYPEVRLTGSPTIEDPSAHVVLRNRGGGIGRVVVWLNGKEVTADARPAGTDAAADSLIITLDFAGSPYLIPGGDNRIEVRAFNADGYLASRARGLGIGSAAETEAASPHLWAVVAGVSDYTGDALDLRYAAKDATDFASALRLAGERLFGRERTHVTLLTTQPGAGDALEPSRTLLTSALRAIADSASATDVAVVYLAGHGVVHGGAEGDYYFLAREARNANLDDPEVRAAVALSSLELTELLKAIPALKQVLILDTCGAGRAVETIVAAREVPSSQIRAMQRMKDRTGTFVLAGSAADAVSYEGSRYAQGVLTYSLLMGLKGAALREGEYIDVATLFGFAVDQVPQLARDIGGIQRPELAVPRAGQSFDIGRLTAEDREQVPLAEAKPLVLRSNFQDERRVVDHLRLTQLVNDALREASAGSRGEGSMVFVDAESFPDAYSIGGRYAVEAGEIRVSARLFRGEAEAGAFEVTGRADELINVAGRIRDEAEALIRAAAR